MTILSTNLMFSYYQKNFFRSFLIQNYDRLNDVDLRRNYFVKQFYQSLTISAAANRKLKNF